MNLYHFSGKIELIKLLIYILIKIFLILLSDNSTICVAPFADCNVFLIYGTEVDELKKYI